MNQKSDTTTNDEKWEKGLAAWKAFVEREGHGDVPSKYVDPDGYKLGSWVSRQRSTLKKYVVES